MMAYSLETTRAAVTSALQCCFHTLFGSCRPTAGGRVTPKPHVPSWGLYSAIKKHRKEQKKAYTFGSWKIPSIFRQETIISYTLYPRHEHHHSPMEALYTHVIHADVVVMDLHAREQAEN